MKTVFTIVLSLFFINSSYSQSEKDEVKKVIETYFKGYKAGDTTVLKEAFHKDFHLSWISPWKKGDKAFKQVDRQGLFAFFGPNWSKYIITSKIKEIKVSNDAATAKVIVTLEGIVEWTDFLSFLKVNDRWWIVSKISEGKKHSKKN